MNRRDIQWRGLSARRKPRERARIYHGVVHGVWRRKDTRGVHVPRLTFDKSVSSRNYTVPCTSRSRSAGARDAANLFSPSLKISDDVPAARPFPCPPFPPTLHRRAGEGRGVISARARESREIYQRAHREYIFKIACTRPVRVRVTPRKFVVAPETRK